MDIIKIFKQNYNAKNAIPMSKYMKNLFPFLGIKKPDRVKLQKEFINHNKEAIDWNIVKSLFKKEEREFHYLAIDYLIKRKELLKPKDLEKIKFLISYKSWWDSVDLITPNLIGTLIKNYPELKKEMIIWSKDENIWINRASLLFQLKYKNSLDIDLLKEIILNCKDKNEFFIDKAIGWILREYSKTNPKWVKDFVENRKLSKLSVREALKHINKSQN